MKQTSLSKWLKLMILGAALCGLVVYAVIIPMLGHSILSYTNGEFSDYYWPWLIFIWTTGIPCYVTLAMAWNIAASIGADQSFTLANAKLLKWISLLAAGDAAFFFLGNLILLLLNKNHPSIVLLSLLVVFAGIFIAVSSAALSHLVMKAAVLQEQSDWTV